MSRGSYPAVIIDNGSGLTKAGIASNDDPSIVFSTVVGRSNDEQVPVCVGKNDEYIGRDAQAKRGVLALTYPIEHGVVTNWDDMEAIWHYTFYNEMNINPKIHPVLLTEAPLNPKENREKMAEVMFEKFEVPQLYIGTQTVLSFYSAGMTTGMVVEVGDGVTHIMPIYDGYLCENATQRLDFAGRDLTNNLQELLIERGYSLSSAEMHEIVREIKEKVGFVSLDFEKDMTTAASSSLLDKIYELPDGQKITLGKERFTVPEALFNPSMVGRQDEGLHYKAFEAVQKSDVDLRKELLSNVVLAGGSTMLPGMVDRMQNELQALASSTVKVSEHPYRMHSAWIGACVLANLSVFQDKWTPRKEYDEFGPELFHRQLL